MSFSRLVMMVVLLAVATASPVQSRNIGAPKHAKAIYFLTNDAVNAVVALPITSDGTLSKGTITATGGNGSNAVGGKAMEPLTPDALVGQSALTISGNVSK